MYVLNIREIRKIRRILEKQQIPDFTETLNCKHL